MKKFMFASLLSFSLFFSGFLGGNAEASTQGVKAAGVAQKYIGVKYVWGGASPKGFDCSGLVGYSFKQSGKTLPRSAAEMYKKGQAVSKSKLQKGDLVFFSTYKKGASHVGIYIGNNKFVHASSSNGVKIDSLGSSYYSKAYLGAKRI